MSNAQYKIVTIKKVIKIKVIRKHEDLVSDAVDKAIYRLHDEIANLEISVKTAKNKPKKKKAGESVKKQLSALKSKVSKNTAGITANKKAADKKKGG